MHAVFRLDGGFLELFAPEAGVEERRTLAADASSRFAHWAEAYAKFRGRDGAEARILALGKDLYTWLDGDERWLERLLAAAVPPLVVEFQVLAAPNDLGKSFLQVSWELLAGETGYLAVDVVQLFCPVRRVGKIEKPEKPDDLCLGLTFMAAAPRGVVELDYGAEENAILDAVGTLGLDLLVEESGNPDLLTERLAELSNRGSMQTLHLSCHGRSDPKPVLLLEDEEGNRIETGPAELIGLLPSPQPRLVFLSACQTAAAGAVADPLAMTLVRAGASAVLGWDGSVYDHEATAFAHALYQALSRRRSLEEAVALARVELFSTGGAKPSRDWHLARLWLGPKGGGKLVGGNKRRWMLAADHGHKDFLDKNKQRPVASREAFVGRRRELQTSLKVLREGDHAGLLIHGMGRLGKSSLTARIAHRRLDLEPVVIFGAYDALSIAKEICDGVPAAHAILDAQMTGLRDAPERLEGLLREVLEGPCQQAGNGKPILLIIDDLEHVLDEPATVGGSWRVKAAYVPVLRAVLRAFARARTASRLLLTSRYTFTLQDDGVDLAARLFAHQLPPMDTTSARLQALRREQARPTKEALQGEAAEAETKRREKLITRAVEIAHGNPGLQDRLFDLILADKDTADKALSETEVYLAKGTLPGREEVRAFLENLAIDKLVGLAGPSARELLRKATLFELPVPKEIAAALADGGDADVSRLMGLGLLDRFEDLVDPKRTAVLINALVRPKAGSLRESEVKDLAARVLDRLFATWGGTDRTRRPLPANAELTRLALKCHHAEVLAVCAADALTWLDQQFAFKQVAD
jgi:hypothetical protein